MRVLVTGGAGYIGSCVVKELCDAGYGVLVVDNLSVGNRRLVDKRAEFLQVDLCDSEQLDQAFRKEEISSVIHLAAWTSVAKSVERPIEYYQNNVGGTLNLLHCCQRYSVQRFVFSSTAAVYADPGQDSVDENSGVDPKTPYGRSKWMMELAIQDLCKATGMRFFILRYFNVAGARKDLSLGALGERTDIFKLVAEVAVGRRPQLEITGVDYPTSDGSGVRDYIHVQDLSQIHLAALKYLEDGGASELANCGYGDGYSVRQVAEAMKKVSGINFKIVESSRRAGDLAQIVANTKKIRTILNWQPQFNDLEFICKTAYEWEKKVLESR